MKKRDRRREQARRALRGERVQRAHEALRPEQYCPRCGSRMGRFVSLGNGQKAVCGRGHVWVHKDDPTFEAPEVVAPSAPASNDVPAPMPCPRCGGGGTDPEPGDEGERACIGCGGSGELVKATTAATVDPSVAAVWAMRRPVTDAGLL